MTSEKRSDGEAKKNLLKWPAYTSELWKPPFKDTKWIRGQPVSGKKTGPRLFAPGSQFFATQPDGLYVYFNNYKWCDVIAIEVCGSIQNLNDKRARYIPGTGSRMLRVNSNWLDEACQPALGKRSRWNVAGTFSEKPTADADVAVRILRVLYFIPNDLYKSWTKDHPPTGYEFFSSHSSLESFKSPKMQKFLSRMSIHAHFYATRGRY